MVPAAHRASLQPAWIAAGVRFGLCKGCRFFATQQRIKVALPQLFRQPQQDRAGRRPKHAVAAVGQCNRAMHFLPHHREGQQRQTLAAEFGRRVELPQSKCACLCLERRFDIGLEIRPLHRVHFDRDQLAIDKFAHRIAQQPNVFCQLKIHCRPSLHPWHKGHFTGKSPKHHVRPERPPRRPARASAATESLLLDQPTSLPCGAAPSGQRRCQRVGAAIWIAL